MELSELQTSLQTVLTIFLPKVVGVLLLLIVSWMASKWLKTRVSRLVAQRLDETLAHFFGSLVKYAVLTMALLGCLSIFGFETTSFAALIGVAGLAIGLALQGTLSNFSSGIMLLLFRPFKIGDFVSAGGVTGTIVEINLFSTLFDASDNRRIIVPNGKIYGSIIENITFHDTRRLEIEVGTDYSADIRYTREVLLNAVKSLDGVLAEPAPAAILKGLGGSSIDWSVRAWTKTSEFGSVREAATESVKNALDKAGISIPFPQMDVHLGGTNQPE